MNIHIDFSNRLQQVEGWGTSLCWFANAIGGWSDESRNTISDLLFSKERGLGLNVVRYNIWGGDNPSHNHMRTGSKADGFLSADGVWDWNADKNQRAILFDAKERGANLFEAFANSPPYWMTISQCSAGAEDGSSNLQEGCYTLFADYLTEVIKHYKQEFDFEFQTIDPLNEPRTSFWKQYNRQEGCHFTPQQQAALIKEVQIKLAEKDISWAQISSSDENSIDVAVETWNYFSRETREMVAQINTHSYEGIKRNELKELAKESKKRLWMSEYGSDGGISHNHDAMQPALELSIQIQRDMKFLQPSAWVYWQAVEDEAGTIKEDGNWGFIHADLTGKTEEYHITKKYYAMAHYSKFVRQGHYQLESNIDNAVVFYDSKGEILVIIAHNATSESIWYAVQLSKENIIKDVYLYRTSENENLQLLDKEPVNHHNINLSLIPYSIITCVIEIGM